MRWNINVLAELLKVLRVTIFIERSIFLNRNFICYNCLMKM